MINSYPPQAFGPMPSLQQNQENVYPQGGKPTFAQGQDFKVTSPQGGSYSENASSSKARNEEHIQRFQKILESIDAEEKKGLYKSPEQKAYIDQYKKDLNKQIANLGISHPKIGY